jgi:hypothetical protein
MGRFGILLLWALLAQQALADTVQERTIASATSPHQAYHSGKPVTVHYARLDGYANLGDGNDALLTSLKQSVQDCARHNPSAKPVTEWPVLMWPHRQEVYATANRRIEYEMGATFLVHPGDCTLISEVVSNATLRSAGRICMIDLVKKIAKGDCGRNGQADAPIPPKPTQSLEQIMKRMAQNPAMAAQVKIMESVTATRTGERRVIKGASCDVWRQKMGTLGSDSTYCMSSGGSFIPAQAFEVGGMGGLMLDNDNPRSWRMHATDVKIDTQVNDAVFTPYMAGGYTFEK